MFQNVPECSRMCRDQNLISATDGADGAEIEKRGVGRPLLGPAKIYVTRFDIFIDVNDCLRAPPNYFSLHLQGYGCKISYPPHFEAW